MPRLNNVFALVATFAVFFCVIDANVKQTIHGVEKLNEDNWDRMLTGEWMVELWVQLFSGFSANCIFRNRPKIGTSRFSNPSVRGPALIVCAKNAICE